MSSARPSLWFTPSQLSLIRFVARAVYVSESVLEIECRLISQGEDDPDHAVRDYLTSILLAAYLPTSNRR